MDIYQGVGVNYNKAAGCRWIPKKTSFSSLPEHATPNLVVMYEQYTIYSIWQVVVA